MVQIGVRELKRDLSGYLKRAADGEEIRVTVRGQPLVDLVPAGATKPMSKLDRMIAEGRATAPRRDHRTVPIRTYKFKGDPLADLLAERDSYYDEP